MEVVLKKDFPALGQALEVIKVKDGYARNYLIPQGIAEKATAGNMKAVAELRRTADKREEKKLKSARQLAKQIEKVPCTIPVKVGEEDRMFGAITAQNIADLLKKEGYDIDKRAIELEEPIRQLGVYNVKVELYKEVNAKLKVWVVKEEA